MESGNIDDILGLLENQIDCLTGEEKSNIKDNEAIISSNDNNTENLLIDSNHSKLVSSCCDIFLTDETANISKQKHENVENSENQTEQNFTNSLNGINNIEEKGATSSTNESVIKENETNTQLDSLTINDIYYNNEENNEKKKLLDSSLQEQEEQQYNQNENIIESKLNKNESENGNNDNKNSINNSNKNSQEISGTPLEYLNSKVTELAKINEMNKSDSGSTTTAFSLINSGSIPTYLKYSNSSKTKNEKSLEDSNSDFRLLEATINSRTMIDDFNQSEEEKKENKIEDLDKTNSNKVSKKNPSEGNILNNNKEENQKPYLINIKSTTNAAQDLQFNQLKYYENLVLLSNSTINGNINNDENNNNNTAPTTVLKNEINVHHNSSQTQKHEAYKISGEKEKIPSYLDALNELHKSSSSQIDNDLPKVIKYSTVTGNNSVHITQPTLEKRNVLHPRKTIGSNSNNHSNRGKSSIEKEESKNKSNIRAQSSNYGQSSSHVSASVIQNAVAAATASLEEQYKTNMQRLQATLDAVTEKAEQEREKLEEITKALEEKTLQIEAVKSSLIQKIDDYNELLKENEQIKAESQSKIDQAVELAKAELRSAAERKIREKLIDKLSVEIRSELTEQLKPTIRNEIRKNIIEQMTDSQRQKFVEPLLQARIEQERKNIENSLEGEINKRVQKEVAAQKQILRSKTAELIKMKEELEHNEAQQKANVQLKKQIELLESKFQREGAMVRRELVSAKKAKSELEAQIAEITESKKESETMYTDMEKRLRNQIEFLDKQNKKYHEEEEKNKTETAKIIDELATIQRKYTFIEKLYNQEKANVKTLRNEIKRLIKAMQDNNIHNTESTEEIAANIEQEPIYEDYNAYDKNIDYNQEFYNTTEEIHKKLDENMPQLYMIEEIQPIKNQIEETSKKEKKKEIGDQLPPLPAKNSLEDAPEVVVPEGSYISQHEINVKDIVGHFAVETKEQTAFMQSPPIMINMDPNSPDKNSHDIFQKAMTFLFSFWDKIECSFKHRNEILKQITEIFNSSVDSNGYTSIKGMKNALKIVQSEIISCKTLDSKANTIFQKIKIREQIKNDILVAISNPEASSISEEEQVSKMIKLNELTDELSDILKIYSETNHEDLMYRGINYLTMIKADKISFNLNNK